MINGVKEIRDVVIVEALRTAMGRAKKGSLVKVRPDDMGALVVSEVVKKSGIDPEEVEDLLVGCAMTEGEQGLNVARQVGFLANLPVKIGAATVNRFCGSSLQTINYSASMIATGAGDTYIAGGIESMSMIPMGGFQPMKAFNPKIVELNKGKPPAFTMPQTGQYVAEKYDISREAQDEFSYRSHMKAAKALDEGKFKDEIVPVPFEKDGEKGTLDYDECIRRETSLEKLAQLQPIVQNFDPDKPPMITAGNSCPMNDGASAALVMSDKKAAELGLKPKVVIRSYAVAGVEAYEMGIGPSQAVPKALKRAGLKLDDMDIIEINEAFASVVLANCKILGLDPDDPRLNPNGGAIALGHPLGASGARIMATAIYELLRTNKKYALVTMCIGGGQGIATIVERA